MSPLLVVKGVKYDWKKTSTNVATFDQIISSEN